METADATPTIIAAAESLRPGAYRKGLGLTIDIPKESLEMQLDHARLRQVLLNLLGNAVKFTDKGEVRVKAWRHENPAEVRVAVEDTGIGIAKEDQARLFVKFTQVDGSYTRRNQGTGLGLAITKSLVQRMGGRISMESEGPGSGTRVVLAFPAVSRAESNPARDRCLNES
jgi:signal transduction histidine kinase